MGSGDLLGICVSVQIVDTNYDGFNYTHEVDIITWERDIILELDLFGKKII